MNKTIAGINIKSFVKPSFLIVAVSVLIHILLNKSNITVYIHTLFFASISYAVYYYSGKTNQQKTPFFSILLSITTILMFIGTGTRYLTNDDIFMILSLKSGENVPFLASVYSRVLTASYTIFPHIPWYGLFLLIGQLFTLNFLFASIFRIKTTRLYKGTITFFCLFIYSQFIIELTFTTAALCLGISSILWFGIKAKAQSLKRYDYIILLLALFIGYCFRPPALILSIVIFSPLLLSFNIKRMIILGCILGSFIGMSKFEPVIRKKLFTKSELAFAHYNGIRSIIHDRPDSACDFEEGLEHVNWSENDFKMFKSWLYQHEKFHSPEDIKALIKTCDKQLSNQNILNQLNEIKDHKHQYFPLLAVLIFILILFPKKLSPQFYATILFSSAIFIYLIIFQKLPGRITNPVLFGIIFFVLTQSSAPVKLPFWKPIILCSSLILFFDFRYFSIPILLSLIYIYDTYKKKDLFDIKLLAVTFTALTLIPLSQRHAKRQKTESKRYTEMNNLMHTHGIKYLYTISGFYYSRSVHPLVELPSSPTQLSLSWLTFSDYFTNDLLPQAGVEKASELWPKFIDNNEVCFISHYREDKKIDEIKTFYFENYCQKVDTIRIKQSDHLDYFRIVSSKD